MIAFQLEKRVKTRVTDLRNVFQVNNQHLLFSVGYTLLPYVLSVVTRKLTSATHQLVHILGTLCRRVHPISVEVKLGKATAQVLTHILGDKFADFL